MGNELKEFDDIKNKIHTIRGKQVILDRDLAELYGVETKQLNKAMRRNKCRFPPDFCFQLNKEEYDSLCVHLISAKKNSLRFQDGTLENGRGKHRKYLPHAYTEQGVAMLSSVLRSQRAVDVNIKIMRAFVAMRRFLYENASVFSRLENVEKKQIKYKIETDQKFEKVFSLIQQKDIKPEKGIFFDGSVFDAHKFAIDLISSAKSSIVLIDNYIDTSVLTLMSHKRKDVEVKIYTHSVTEKLKLSKEKFNKQYGKLELIEFRKAHDRFLIIDDAEVYHIGASLKDLGKRWFGFSRLQKEGLKVLDKF